MAYFGLRIGDRRQIEARVPIEQFLLITHKLLNLLIAQRKIKLTQTDNKILRETLNHFHLHFNVNAQASNV